MILAGIAGPTVLREGWKPAGARRRPQAGGSTRSATAWPRAAGTRPAASSVQTSAPDAELVIGDLTFQAIGSMCTSLLPMESAWWSDPAVHMRGL